MKSHFTVANHILHSNGALNPEQFWRIQQNPQIAQRAKVTAFVTWQSKSDPRRPRTACAKSVYIYTGTGACTDMDSCGWASHCKMQPQFNTKRVEKTHTKSPSLHRDLGTQCKKESGHHAWLSAAPQSRHTRNLNSFHYQCSWSTTSMQLFSSHLGKRFLAGIFS